MESLLQDVRYAMRMLRKNLGFTTIAILTLAVGIGANTSIFSVVYGVLLKSLPLPESHHLYLVAGTYPNYGRTGISLPDYVDLKAQNSVFTSVTAFTSANLNLSGESDPERVQGHVIAADFFKTLGIQPLAGRDFAAGEYKAGSTVAIISEGYWQRRFGGDRGLVGRKVMINGTPREIVGVAPANLQQLTKADLFLPLTLDPAQANRRGEFLNAIGRVKPGVTGQQVIAELKLISSRLAQQYPDTNGTYRFESAPLQQDMVSNYRQALFTLWGAVVFVLLIVCANLANLLLARAAGREKEIAVRAAMGAHRYRIVRQLLTESVVLAVAGGVLGMLIATWGVELLKRVFTDVPRLATVEASTPVMLFALGLSVLTGIFFGLMPALHSVRANVNHNLKESGRGTHSAGNRWRSALVVTQVAISLTLLIGAGLMIRSFHRLQNVNTGFQSDSRMTARVALPGSKYSTPGQQSAFFQRLVERVSALPGVENAGAISGLYLRDGAPVYSFDIEGRQVQSNDQFLADAHIRYTTPGVYRALAMQVVRGRLFSEQDGAQTPLVALVNEAFVKRFLSDVDPVGMRVAFNYPNRQPQWRTIVGVVANARQESVDKPAYPEIQAPITQYPAGTMSLVVRTNTDPRTVAGPIRQIVRDLDPTLPVFALETMDDVVATSLQDRRLNLYLLSIFAGVALLLSALGIYGVMAYAVLQRTGEIGVRMALGAQRPAVLRMFLRQGLVLAAIGIWVGLAAALALARSLSRLLFEVSAVDPVTFASVAIILALVAIFASYIPARRATRVDPMVALRYE